MKKLLKIMSAAFVISAAITTVAHAEFTDMPSDTRLSQALNNAVTNGLLTGISDTEIAPDMALTRAQMATILTRALGAKTAADISAFGDVKESDWYYDSMAKAVYMGAFKGDGENLSPEAQITTEQAYTVLSRIFCLKYSDESSVSSLPDISSVSDWAKEHVIKIYTSGYECNASAINPQKPMTRAEFAVTLDNLVKTYINEPGTYTELPDGNIVVRSENVTFKDLHTDGDVYIADGVTGNTVFDGGEIERIVVRGGNCKFSSTVSSVYAAMPGVVLSPTAPYSVKAGKDGSKGTIEATVDGTHIDLGTLQL